MEEQLGKRIPIEKLTTPLVYEHLQSTKVIDNLYKDVLARIQDTPSYKRMKEVAVMHMAEILTDSSKSVPCPEDRIEKKKQIAEIGLLALSIDSSMSQIITENLGERAENIISSALKELSGNELKNQTETVTRSAKRAVIAQENHNNHIVPEYNKETYKKSVNTILDSDIESNASNGSFSVSSVHTSDLSSFDAEIELSDKEDGMTIRKKVPLKFVNELMLNNKFSGACQDEEVYQQTEASASKSYSHPEKLKPKSPDGNSQRTLSKRIRKPNSKYTSKDMLLDAIHPRQKELLDVQRDLNIINGTNTKGESSKSSLSRKRKAD